MDVRSAQRIHLTCQLNVVDRLTNQIIGQVADITSEGVMLIGEKQIKSNIILYITMDLPEKILGKTNMFFAALSRWWKKEDDNGKYLTGLSLRALESGDMKIINSLIDKYGIPV